MKSKIPSYRNQDNDETADGDFNADDVDDDDDNNVVDHSYLAFVGKNKKLHADPHYLLTPVKMHCEISQFSL